MLRCINKQILLRKEQKMINTIEQAVRVQTNRYNSGKPFMAKAVKTFLKTATPGRNALKDLGAVTYTPPGYKRAEAVFGPSPQKGGQTGE